MAVPLVANGEGVEGDAEAGFDICEPSSGCDCDDLKCGLCCCCGSEMVTAAGACM